jgi:predicted amidohydrolase YtcJ
MLVVDAMIGRQFTITDALSAYTSGSAFAEFQERDKGIIARGQLADMVILSDDILSIAPERIKDVQVLATIVGGKVVHQRKP